MKIRTFTITFMNIAAEVAKMSTTTYMFSTLIVQIFRKTGKNSRCQIKRQFEKKKTNYKLQNYYTILHTRSVNDKTSNLILGKKLAPPVRVWDVMDRQSQVVVTVLKEE